MKIEHIAMYVDDLKSAREFFVRYFSADCGQLYHNCKTGFRSYFLLFDGGARLEIMNRPHLSGENLSDPKLGYAHMAFSVGSAEAVDALTERLRNDGYSVASGPRLTGDGYYESCIIALEGNLIEITP